MYLFRRLILFCICIAIMSTNAYASETSVQQTVLPGTLEISSVPSATMTAVQPGGIATSDDITTTVTDARGTAAGWTATAALGNFVHLGEVVQLGGHGVAPALSGTYERNVSGSYTIVIDQGGPVGTATYHTENVGDAQPTTPTSSAAPLALNGLYLHFQGSYSPGDKWNIKADVIPAGNAKIIPFSAAIGQYENISQMEESFFSGQWSQAPLAVAATGYGRGRYRFMPRLILNVPFEAATGDYTTTLIETVS
jgi:hypothetical protein